MIVKRLAGALRRQDWAAVAVEFLLVVTGVVLAFQITAWASERQALIERAAATERLLQESEQVVAYFRSAVATQAALMGDLDYALGHVQRGTWPAGDQARMTRGLLRMLNAASPAPPSSVYDDLVASGSFGGIGDARLRTAIANYRATLAYNSKVVDYLRQRMPSFEQHASLHYVFAPTERGRTRLDVNFAKLAADSQLLESLALVAGGHFQLLQIRRRTQKDAEIMCVELGRFVGQACNLHRPVPTF